MLTGHRRKALAAIGGLSGLMSMVSLAYGQPSGPPTDDPLAAARALFADALRDEQAGQFSIALEEFMRVRLVRDTPSIEYRIGSCYEGLGKPAPAFAAYRLAVELGHSDPQGLDVTRAASARLEVLGKHIAQLTLTMPSPLPAGTDVHVDSESVWPTTSEPIPLSPGHHVVSATAPGAAPFHAEIALAEGAQVSLTVTLEGEATAHGVETVPAERKSYAAIGWFAIGTGAALLAASAVLFVVRHTDIESLDHSCPGGTCPPGADADVLESTRNRALVEGPVAAGCGIAGIAAASLGLYAVVSSPRSTTVAAPISFAPIVARGGAGISAMATFR